MFCSCHTIHNTVRHEICQRVLPLIEFPNPLNEITIISPILWGRTQSKWAIAKSLSQGPNIIGQCKNKWSTDSSLLLLRMHQWGLRDLYGLLTCNILMVFTFLCGTNQAKALNFEGAFDFQTKLARRKGLDLRTWTRLWKEILLRINQKKISTKLLNLH